MLLSISTLIEQALLLVFNISTFGSLNFLSNNRKSPGLRPPKPNPDILILDESTNNLDIDVENKILNDLQKLKDTKTIIFITHRENPLIYCDEIYEIVNGNAKKK